MQATLYFLQIFAFSIWAVFPLLLFLSVIILGLGCWAGRFENWTFYDRLYWSFITATTVGYGDKSPRHGVTKLFSVVIALSGIIMTGIIVSCAVFSAGEVLKIQVDPHEVSELKKLQQQVREKH